MFLAILLNEQFLHLAQINTQLLSTQQHTYTQFLVTSWFDSVCITFGMLELIFKKTIYMNMNYGFLTTKYESIFAQMYILLVEKYVLQFWLNNFHSKKEKRIVNNTRKTYSWAKILPYIVEG